MAKDTEDRQNNIDSFKLEVNGQKAHYLKAGSGPPIVLLHGGASDSRDWISTMPALSHRYSLYAPDLIGFGQSDRDRDGYYLSDFTEFILGFIDALKLEQPVLAGHSLGGRICLEIALRHPEKVRKLVLIDAAGLGTVSALGSAVLTAFWAMRKLLRRPKPYPEFLFNEGEDVNWLCVDELKNLKMPTLIVWKHFDLYFPLAIARRASKLIPRAHLVVLPGYGHAPHEQNKSSFNHHLLNFLDHEAPTT